MKIFEKNVVSRAMQSARGYISDSLSWNIKRSQHQREVYHAFTSFPSSIKMEARSLARWPIDSDEIPRPFCSPLKVFHNCKSAFREYHSFFRCTIFPGFSEAVSYKESIPRDFLVTTSRWKFAHSQLHY